LNQAAQQLAEAEQAVSKPLAPPGEALPEAAAPAAGPEQDIPFPRRCFCRCLSVSDISASIAKMQPL